MQGHIKKSLKKSSARGKTAAVFIDFQNQFFDAQDRDIFENAADFAQDLRGLGIEPVWVAYSSLNRPATKQCLSVHEFQATQYGPGESLSRLVKAAPNETVILKDRPQAFEEVIDRPDKVLFPSALSIHLDTMGVDTLLVSGVMAKGCVAATLRNGVLSDKFTIVAVADCINIPAAEHYKDFYKGVATLSEDPKLMRSQFAIARCDDILPYLHKSRTPKPRTSVDGAERIEPYLPPGPVSIRSLVA